VDARDPNAAVAGLPGSPKVREFAADELAPDLHLTWQTAAGQIVYACTVAARLPVTFAALRAGQIHPVHLRIIEDETAYLSDEHVAEADAKLAEAARSKTFGELRYYAHRLVLKLDPESALRRKDEARKDAHVRPFREGSGNAGMSARELPPDEVLASWQHVDQRARDLRAAGVPGTLQRTPREAYLDLLARARHPHRPAQPPGPGPTPPRRPATRRDRRGRRPSGDRPRRERWRRPMAGAAAPAGRRPRRERRPGRRLRPRNGPGGTGGPAPAAGGDSGPSLAAQVTLTIPWATLHGGSTPGEAGGFGLLDPETARDLAAAAARHPAPAGATPRCTPTAPPPRTPAPPARTPAGPPTPAPSNSTPSSAAPATTPRPRRLPARPQAPPPGHRPQRHVHRAGLRAARRPLRPGSHHPLAPRRAHVSL
jgi:hypothetical protein